MTTGCKAGFLAVFLLSLMMLSPTAQAEKRLALVIGNSNYVVQPLANPVRDSELMAQTLRDIGFEVQHYTDLGERDFLRAIITFGKTLRAAGEDSVGLFFFAGHAIQAEGENYLIPVDATLEDELDLEIQTIEASAVMRALESAGNRLNLVFLDACRNNPFRALSRSGTRGLAKMEAPSGTLVSYSTAPGDVATDGSGENSPYTRALAKAIRAPGQAIELTMKQVRIEVMERTGTQQVPWESSSLTGDFFFTPAVAEADQSQPVVQVHSEQTAEVDFWREIDKVGLEAGYIDYLAQYPEGLFKVLAQSRLEALVEENEANRALEAQKAEVTYFQTIQQSESIEGYASYLEQFPNGLFREIAVGRMNALQKQDEADATSAAPADAALQEEIAFFRTIQQSESAEGYSAYLNRYPSGLFVDVATGRLNALNAADAPPPSEVQVAALPGAETEVPVGGDTDDGNGLFTGTLIGSGAGGWARNICGDGANHPMSARLDGEFIRVFIAFGNDEKDLKLHLEDSGRFIFKFGMIMGKTSSAPFVLRGRYDGTKVSGTMFHLQSDACDAKFTLTQAE